MKTIRLNSNRIAALSLINMLVVLHGFTVSAATVRVWQDSPNPAPPYTNWATAAHAIQEAVDAAAPGDDIVVTNGVYATGGRAVHGLMTNRLVVDKPVTVRSVNGPAVTLIQGYQVPEAWHGLGDGAIRCVYLTSGAVLSGFTLTNGATCGWTADYYLDQSGGGVWCASTNALVTNCTLMGNFASSDGGGAYSGTLHNCAFTNNAARYGGGASSSTLNNCTLTGNSVKGDDATGGGASESTLNNCTLAGNSASCSAGGAYESTLNNCVLTGNSAPNGGGADYSTLNNCTLTGNSAGYDGGGARYATLNNCILYYNTAFSGPNYGDASTLNYCCTTPDPGTGAGNITAEPQLGSASHLSTGSPCRGAGSAAYATGLDIDGESWLNPPSIGCDEYRTGDLTGAVTVAIRASWTNVAVGFPVDLTGWISGRVAGSAWDFGDGTVLSNRQHANHAWEAPRDYTVALRAYNESHPEGVSATLTVRVLVQPVHCVSVACTNPVSPYSSWETAARTIQDAVDAAVVPGALVLVSNGMYATGGRAVYGTMTNRVAVDKPVTVRSVNGPEVTAIQGYQVPGNYRGLGDGAIRCVYLTNGAVLSGFTLTNGATRDGSADYVGEQNGGGVWSESANARVTNCTLTGNSASSGGGAYQGTLDRCILAGNLASWYGGGASFSTLNNCALTGNSTHYGGGAYYSTLNNCVLTGNSASGGGGAYGSILHNCTLTGNSAYYDGGGAAQATLNNCILYFNTANSDSNYDTNSTLNYCCTTPAPANGTGNVTREPQLASTSHLSASSPCRGSGNAAYAVGADIDGESWLNPPSIGCDEYRPGAVTGVVTVAIGASSTNVAVGFPLDLTGSISGRVAASAWHFGDGTVLSNRPYARHAWSAAGDYPVVLRAYNDSHPEGFSATVTIRVMTQPVHYVSATSANPVPPHSSWATAAHTIQDAVDAAAVGGEVVVTNGVYATGGRAVWGGMTNRVAVDKPLTVRSVNGPEATTIEGCRVPETTNGNGAVRCVYLTTGAVLSGFTLTNGATRDWRGDGEREQNGGGVWCQSISARVTNCTLTGNSASSSGGGAYNGTLDHCILTGNAARDGGGASFSTLNNCTLTGNSTGTYGYGGGVGWSTLNNCTLTGNCASEGGGGSSFGGGASESTLNNCLLTGNSASGGGGAYESTLNKCTLTGNVASEGGGMWRGTLNNCVLAGNSAAWSAGGAYMGRLNNCVLTGNSAAYGGGAGWSTLYNCTLTGNSASRYGGGAYESTMNNCILYYNWVTLGEGPNHNFSTLNYCCTTPLPTNGVGNLTQEPAFVDFATGNLRPQSNSPGINAGNNDCVSGATDLDGRPRIAGGTVDMGAYEYQGAGMGEFIGWLQQYGLPTDGSADYSHSDSDGLHNYQEYRCGTDPTNALSVLCLLTPLPTSSDVMVSWQSVAGVRYFLERSANLGASPPFLPLATNLIGQPGTTSFTDTNAAPAPPAFYRVGVPSP